MPAPPLQPSSFGGPPWRHGATYRPMLNTTSLFARAADPLFGFGYALELVA